MHCKILFFLEPSVLGQKGSVKYEDSLYSFCILVDYRHTRTTTAWNFTFVRNALVFLSKAGILSGFQRWSLGQKVMYNIITWNDWCNQTHPIYIVAKRHRNNCLFKTGTEWTLKNDMQCYTYSLSVYHNNRWERLIEKLKGVGSFCSTDSLKCTCTKEMFLIVFNNAFLLKYAGWISD